MCHYIYIYKGIESEADYHEISVWFPKLDDSYILQFNKS